MDLIKLLENTEVGMFLVICIGEHIRCISLYMGKDSEGRYNFIDESGIFAYSKEYLLKHEHIKIDTELKGDDEIITLSKLLDKVKEVKP